MVVIARLKKFHMLLMIYRFLLEDKIEVGAKTDSWKGTVFQGMEKFFSKKKPIFYSLNGKKRWSFSFYLSRVNRKLSLL
jgi:hypothetical protein